MARILALLLCAATLPRHEWRSNYFTIKDIVVLQTRDLPEIAQSAGQSMALHTLGNGSTYLYIEQQQFGRLAILDVTDLSHVKAVGVAHLDISAPFDFVRPLGDSAELVCFRGEGGAAVLDLHHPKQPALTSVNGLRHVASTEALGGTGFLLLNNSKNGTELIATDYQILDTSNPNSPRLLATVANVQQKLTSQMIGAVYLLGSDGLTIVRRPRVEEENETSKSSAHGAVELPHGQIIVSRKSLVNFRLE
jgi:hypothetical protein